MWPQQAQAADAVEILSKTPACAYDCVIDSFKSAACGLGDVTTCVCSNITLQAELSISAAVVEGDLCAAYPKASRSLAVERTIIVGSAVVFPTIVLRLFARARYAKRLWIDDYITILAAGLLGALATTYLYIAYIGFGMHYWTIQVGNGTVILKLLYVGSLLYAVLQAVGKLSIVLFLMRIFPLTSFQRLARALTLLIFLHGAALLIPSAIQCLPINSIWDRNITERRCVNLTAVGYSNSALAIAEDVAILVLPIPQIWRLQISLHRRLALLALFSIGFFACLTSMIRMKFLVQYADTFDATWDHVDIVMWSFIEQAAALLCASLPAARLLVVNLLAHLKSKHRSSSRSQQGHFRTQHTPDGITSLGVDEPRNQDTHEAQHSKKPDIPSPLRINTNGGITVTRAFEISWPGSKVSNHRDTTYDANLLSVPPATHYRG
ncbi:uncharacterized protein CTRU02_215475 [Colletotrichum truncatum]|uniref:Integral membrane protein n=1 Tax=Colletotrichum truncatum TaxID=5467 RepID=A0ACC3YCJ9_COLTU|nr:uncharacterized protein CTRU02_05582 [Colletotrichum truncatum]KAF6794025.1 integral membrane protein [Colletotrichum truncatum]